MMQQSLFVTDDVTKSDRYIYTPSRFAKVNLLYIQESGMLKSLKAHECKRKELDSYLILVVMEGSGKVKINDNEYSIRANEAIWIDCMESYSHMSSDEDPWKLGWIHFNGNTAKALYDKYVELCENRVFALDDMSGFMSMLSFLLANHSTPDELTDYKCHKAITEIIDLIYDSIASNEAIGKMDARNANSIREYINAHYMESAIIDQIKSIYVDWEMAGSKFAKVYGISIEEYLKVKRFNSAKEMLRFTVKSVDEIVNETGLESVDEFISMFKDMEDSTPDEYRNKWAGWVRE